jgi:hypothetical protein
MPQEVAVAKPEQGAVLNILQILLANSPEREYYYANLQR